MGVFVMTRSSGLWAGLYLALMLADAKTVNGPEEPVRVPKQPGTQVSAPDQNQNQVLDQVQVLPEVLDLDLDRVQRVVRGAGEEDEQQSTFGQSFENDSVTAPQATDFTATEPQGGGAKDGPGHRGNGSGSPAPPGLFNPFVPAGDGAYAAYGVLLLAGLVLAVGVVGNLAVVCVVGNNFYMRSAWNYLLCSVAFWDFLVLVLCLPVVVVNQLSHWRILGDITCRMVPYMEAVSLGVTSFSLCALGIDRFHAATSSSVGAARRVERCGAVTLRLLLVWIAALTLAAPEVFLWTLSVSVAPSNGRLVDTCTITTSSPLSLHLPDSLHSLLLRYHQGRMWWCFGCYFCLPVLFTVLCQMATRNVNSDSSSAHKQRCHDDGSANQKQRERHREAERQLNCTLLALAVVYGVCSLPEHVVNITLSSTHLAVSEDAAAILDLLHHFLLFFKASVTPVLLLCLCKALGQAFMDCCCCCCQECQPITPQGSPSPAHLKLKAANETSVFFDKAKDTSAVMTISS